MLHFVIETVIPYFALLIFIYPTTAQKGCNSWGYQLADGANCPTMHYRTRINNEFNLICCIPQPDCPPGLVPETLQDLNKEYDGTLEISCVEAPKLTTRPESSSTSSKTSYTIRITERYNRWVIFSVIAWHCYNSSLCNMLEQY